MLQLETETRPDDVFWLAVGRWHVTARAGRVRVTDGRQGPVVVDLPAAALRGPLLTALEAVAACENHRGS